ncbi:DUF2956 domain-containing protein [Litoribacillus peritrichatus]|uniref:DUF2956 domain-containing protein n=1 Tax=Litoribacillus peritrichatus TaxID=718191 RepID=A0ABP7N0B3_9GAMM
MARYTKNKSKDNAVSEETKQEAMAIAKGTQKPGQTKEQTKLIAQGIQKGIDQYKKQQKAKAREFDKQKKKALAANQAETASEVESEEVANYRLPWFLLAASWVLFGLSWFVFFNA